jgi:integrase
MAAKTLDTSITDTTARNFLKEAGERETLFCKKVTGLHLVKLKTGGSWRYRYLDASGKRRVATLGRFTELKPQQAAELALEKRGTDMLAEKEQNRRKAIEDAAQAEHRTIRNYLDGPYQRYQSRKKTGDETLSMIRFNFADLLDRDMAGLTASDIRAWQYKREGEGRAHVTLKRAYGALKTMLRHASRQDPPIIENNPLERVSLERPTDDERAEQLSVQRSATRRLLSDDEIHGLLEGLDAYGEELRAQRRNSRAHGKPYLPDLDAVSHPHWFIPFTYCALYTGLRTGDLYALTWDELNINFGRLVKVPEKTRHHPNPAKITMDLPDELLLIMRGWWGQQGKPTTGLVFPSGVSGGRMDKKAHGRSWKRVKRLGGIPDDLTFYSLRHHFISTLVASGVPMLTVARLAGHKGTQMIEQNYGHLCPTAARDAMATFAAKIGRRKVDDVEAQA